MKASRAKPVERSSDLQLFLRIRHPSLDPAEISRILDTEPEDAVAAGPEVSSAGVQRLHSETYWIARLPMTSIAELTQRFREGGLSESMLTMTKQEVVALVGASVYDLRILPRLKRFECHQDFFDRINRDGGSITLIVDRGEPAQPVVLKHALEKLVALGIALEVD